MKRIVLLTLGIIFSFSCHLQAIDKSGNITVDETWAAGDYEITSNLTIQNGVTVTIESGSTIKVHKNQSILVKGTLDATGAHFTSNEASKAKGDWYHIQVGDYYNAGTANFNNCTIEYAGGGNQANVYCYNGTANISNGCNISNSRVGGILINANGILNLQGSNLSNNDWPVVYNGTGSFNNGIGNTFNGNTHDGLMVNFGSMNNTSFTLPKIAVPIVFYHHFRVYENGSLIIPSGNLVKGRSVIYVDGIFKAIADVGEKITFTSYNNDNIGGDTNADGAASAPGRGSWGGIQFQAPSNDAECIMQRCEISHGGNSSNGAIYVNNASPTIIDCQMLNNNIGAEIIGVSAPVFKRNTMASSRVVPIVLSFDANPDFADNAFSFSDNEHDAIGLRGGTLGANSTLIKRDVTGIPNVTYLMMGNLIIPDGISLTIEKGIVIKTYSNYAFTVKGTLIADGDAGADQIIFTSSKDDNHGNPMDSNKDGTQSNPNRGNWGGIIFENTSNDAACLLDHCVFKYGGISSRHYNGHWISGGMIVTENASPTITNCEIKDANYGIYAFQASNPTIQNNTFTNMLYTPITMSISANPTFAGNSFANNGITALGIIGETLSANGNLTSRNVAGYNNITYSLMGDVTISAGTSVEVKPGVVIKMNAGTDFFVDGGFKLDGNATDSIVITSIHDDNYGNPGDTRNDGDATAPSRGNWNTIEYRSTADDAFNTIDYCNILYGGSGSLTFNDASNTVKHSILSDGNGYGIICKGSSNPDLTGKVEIKNMRLSAIAMSLKSGPIMNFSSPIFVSRANGSNGIFILEGNLSTDATLDKRDVGGIYNVAYRINNLTIQAGAKLTINPGVVIKFEDYNDGIEVHGALDAKGTLTSPIVFTSVKDDSKGGDTNDDGNASSPDRGNWRAIIFHPSALDGDNALKHCIFNYGGNAYYHNNFKEYGMVRTFDAEVNIDNCKLEHSNTCGVGIYGSANPTISNCEINNINYTPINMSMFSNPTFTNNSASNIGIMAIGLAKETFSVDGTIPQRNFGGYTNITYFCYGTLSVNSGTEITIPEGIVFKSSGKEVFDVSGKLTINGTVANPVIFTHQYDDNYGKPLDTNNNGLDQVPTSNSGTALVFQDISDDLSTVNHTIISYYDTGIRLQQAAPTVQNCIFDKTNWGTRLLGVSTPAIINNTFKDLTYCPMLISLVSYPSSTVNNLIEGSTWHAIGVLSEELVQDALLPKRNFGGIENLPYYFSGNYTIGTSVTLTIEKGVTCKFNRGARLYVERGLLAEGGPIAEEKIVFTDYRDDFYGGDTNRDSTATDPNEHYYSWRGIEFRDVALDNLCKLDHCIIRYAGYSNSESAITTIAASPSITNTLITNNINGIRATGASNPLIKFCDIYNNSAMGVDNVNKAFTINATECWWGDNSGPTHATNPTGIGDAVSDKVTFTPWAASGIQNPLMGDVSLNGLIQAYDASLVLQHTTSSIVLNTAQQEVADVSDNGTITALDATHILEYVAGINQVFIAEMKSAQSLTNARFAFANASISSQGLLNIPIQMINGRGSKAIDLTINFDNTLLNIEDVTLGANAEDRLLAYNVSSPNELKISIAGTQTFGIDAEMANLRFSINTQSQSNEVTQLAFTKANIDENSVLENSQGKSFTLQNILNGTQNVITKDNYSFEAYPIPADNFVNIGFTVPSNQTFVKIDLYSSNGKLIRNLILGDRSAGSELINIPLTEKAGLYFISYQIGNERNFRHLVIQ